jgi:hypothetical protein
MEERDLFNHPIEDNMGAEDIGDEDGSSRLFDELKKDEKIKVSITLDKKVVEDLGTYKKQKGIKELSPMINIVLREWLRKNLRKTNGKKKGKK